MEKNLPIYNKLKEYLNEKPLKFHMPGHKGKCSELDDICSADIDLTEIDGLDDLHSPEGCIKEAQELAASAYGVRKTFFLVNGSTGGILSAVMTVCPHGSRIIVNRDCHKSVVNAIILSGAEPVYINPQYDNDFNIPLGISYDDVRNAVETNGEITAVLLTTPNYYGVCTDIKEIAEYLHSKEIVLIVDEAHGAHLKFSDRLPVSAVESGADICVQSGHKTLATLTQGAYIHINGERIDEERLSMFLSMFQTSSPSYILMASLDYSRHLMQTKGEFLLNNLLDEINIFKQKMKENTRFRILSEQQIGKFNLDCTRIVINTRSTGKSGYETEEYLRDEYKIYAEMADLNNVVFIASIFDQKCEFNRLYEAFYEINKKFNKDCICNNKYNRLIEIPEKLISPGDVFGSKMKKIHLSESIGYVCYNIITPYPPGVPIICPGERIEKEMVELINEIVLQGGKVTGLTKDNMINVVDENI